MTQLNLTTRLYYYYLFIFIFYPSVLNHIDSTQLRSFTQSITFSFINLLDTSKNT